MEASFHKQNPILWTHTRAWFKYLDFCGRLNKEELHVVENI